MFMQILLDQFPKEALTSLCVVTTELIQKGNIAKANGIKSWYVYDLFFKAHDCCRWKTHEACLLALGQGHVELKDALDAGTIHFDLLGLIHHVVLPDIQSEGKYH